MHPNQSYRGLDQSNTSLPLVGVATNDRMEMLDEMPCWVGLGELQEVVPVRAYVVTFAGKDLEQTQGGYLGIDTFGPHPPVHQRPGPVIIPECDVEV